MRKTLESNGASARLDRRRFIATLLGLLPAFGCSDGSAAKGYVVAIHAHGGFHTCAVFSSGSVKCWGQNTAGQLGNGTTTSSSTPVVVSNLGSATAIAAGSGFTCALLSGGTIKCWGSNDWGQLGSATTNYLDSLGDPCSLVPVPVPVSGLAGATAVGAGSAHTCAAFSGGTVQCWGANYEGQLGDGMLGTETGSITTGSPTAMTVVAVSGATALAANNITTCALLSDGTVQCWGSNFDDALGAGAGSSLTPVAVQGISGATVLAGGGAMCVLVSGGTVQCWGPNSNGQLGDGTTNDSRTPLTVAGLGGVTLLAAGGRHT